MSVVEPGGRVDGRRLFHALYRRTLEANLVGATLAFVYFVFVAPPQPPPPHDESFLYVAVAAAVGYRIGRRRFQASARWLDEARPPTPRERAFVLSLPWRGAKEAAVGWGIAAAVFGIDTATHHPAVYVAGVTGGILLAGLTAATATYLVCERTLRPVFVRALAGQLPADGETARTLGTRTRLLVSWALGSGA